jgi:uncharacterized protein (TIGR03083 family)
VNADPRPPISVLRSSQKRLAALVEPLIPDGVEAPSMADEWTIAQVMSHLGSQAEIFGAILQAGIDDSEIPGPESFPPVWDRWNAKDPVDQARDSLAANDTFLKKIEGLSDAQLDSLRFALFGMDLDLARVVMMRLNELALHTWDIAAAVDAGALVGADAVDLVVDTLPDMARRIGKAPEKGLRVRIVTSDPARDLVLATDEAVTIDQWDDGPVDGVLRLPAESLVRLVYGRLDDEHTADVDFESDEVDLNTLRSVFPGV